MNTTSIINGWKKV